MDALALLAKPKLLARHPVYVLSGEEDFLKRRCREAIVDFVLGQEDPDFALSTYPGEKLDISTVLNDLDTVAFLASVRVIVVEQADPFVAAHREALERYLAKPSKIGVLLLEVKSFPETTKLAKALPDGAKVACKPPAPAQLVDWTTQWAKRRYAATLAADACELLVDRIGASLGLLDQELAKLAVAAGANREIGRELVDLHTERSKSENVFDILSAIGEGRAVHALAILHRLFEEGEDALALLGPLVYQLRKLATVNRYLALGQALGPAMDRAGVPKWPMIRQSTEKQLRHLGRRRLERLTAWCIEVNAGLKGGSPLPPRLQIERLIAKLAAPRTAAGS